MVPLPVPFTSFSLPALFHPHDSMLTFWHWDFIAGCWYASVVPCLLQWWPFYAEWCVTFCDCHQARCSTRAYIPAVYHAHRMGSSVHETERIAYASSVSTCLHSPSKHPSSVVSQYLEYPPLRARSCVFTLCKFPCHVH